MNELGRIYFRAHDIPGRELKDYPKARFWFEKAAGSRYTPAITQLGVMYSGDGSWGVPSDHAKAADLFLEAAGAGDPRAMNNVAVAYYRGDGIPDNDYAAKQWWQRAVDKIETELAVKLPNHGSICLMEKVCASIAHRQPQSVSDE